MKKMPRWLKLLLFLLAFYFIVLRPIPFFIERPGSAFGLDEMVVIDGETKDNPGEFYITTVGIQQATPLTTLMGFLPYHDILTENQLFGDVSDFEEYDVIQQYYMNSSSNTAIQVAFEAAEEDYELVYNGVYVLQVIEESDFLGRLKVGDTVKAVDQNHFQSSQEFINYISQLEVGSTVEIEFEREGEMKTASGELIQLESGLSGIGIGLVDNTRLETTPEVIIESGNIGGPSAGLMFSLHIYNEITQSDLLGNLKIAGTGTIAPDGTVGRIGGIAKKVVAADEEGATYFFAPDDELPAEVIELYPEMRSNYEEAVEAAKDIETDMQVIPIKTFNDALDFLNSLELQDAAQYNQDLLVGVNPFITGQIAA